MSLRARAGRANAVLRHRLGDMALLRHCGDHLRCALRRAVRVAVGRELARRFHQSGENGGFGQGERFCAMAEVAFGGGFDAIGAGAEIDAVEIEFEDLVLGIFALEPERENRFLNLARNRAFLGQEEIFGELLGQGRTALHAAAAGDVADHGAADADRIDAQMRIEAAVLDGDEGLRRIGRKVREPDRRAAGVAAIGEKRRRWRRGWRYWAGAWAPPAGRSAAGANRNRRQARRPRSSPRAPALRPNRSARRRASASGGAGSCGRAGAAADGARRAIRRRRRRRRRTAVRDACRCAPSDCSPVAAARPSNA